MKVAIIISRLNSFGGTQRQAIELARRLKARIYTLRYDPDNTYDTRDIDVTQLTAKKASKIPLFARYIDRIDRAKQMAGIIDKDTEILNPHGNWSQMVAYYYKQKQNIPSVWQLNTLVKEPFDKKYVYAQDQITVLDSNVFKQVVKTYNHIPKIVRTGLDLDKFKFKQRTSLHQRRVLMVSSFLPHRNFEPVIKVSNKLGFPVTIVGEVIDKIYYEKIRNYAKYLTHKQGLSDQELLNEYYNHDVFIFPNNPQVWGLAVFEAMATGLPVIVSTGAGASEVLSSGINAMLMSDHREIELAMTRALNGSNYEALSLAGRKFVEENLSWDKYAEEMLRIFNHARC